MELMKIIFLYVILIIMYKNINKQIFDRLLKYINTNYPNKRKPKYSIQYYLQKIIYLTKNGVSWRALDTTTNINNHYSSIYKKYKFWNNNNVFHDVWNDIINGYKKKTLRKCKLLNLFIDSTSIRNIKGHDMIGRNYADKNRYGTKISVICDSNKIPLSVSVYPANVHDTQTINGSIDNLNINHKTPIKINLIGDKGYIINKNKRKLLKRNNNIKLITPIRKNQKAKITKGDKELLKTRCLVEHVFMFLKMKKRIHVRYDNSINSFNGFIYLALIMQYYTKIVK